MPPFFVWARRTPTNNQDGVEQVYPTSPNITQVRREEEEEREVAHYPLSLHKQETLKLKKRKEKTKKQMRHKTLKPKHMCQDSNPTFYSKIW